MRLRLRRGRGAAGYHAGSARRRSHGRVLLSDHSRRHSRENRLSHNRRRWTTEWGPVTYGNKECAVPELFETTSINGMTLANRFVRSATWEGLAGEDLSLIHISEPTRRTPISYAV